MYFVFIIAFGPLFFKSSDYHSTLCRKIVFIFMHHTQKVQNLLQIPDFHRMDHGISSYKII